MNRILGTRFRRQAAVITERQLAAYRQALIRAEKSRATVEKYLRDAALFCAYAARRPLTKELVVAYKQSLLSQKYAMRTVNAKLCAINGLLAFLGRGDLRVKGVRCQRQLFCSRQQALTKAEYLRLLQAAG